MPDPLVCVLDVAQLTTGYDKRPVLTSVSLRAFAGEVIALIGHNGSGKSTLLKCIFGMLPAWSGTIHINGVAVKRMTPAALLRRGVTYSPQGNRLFNDLTVRENLALGGIALDDPKAVARRVREVLVAFPAIEPYLSSTAGVLSGGQKQMVSLARAMISSPQLLLLDEPSAGLAAPLVAAKLQEIQQLSRTRGIAIVIVEQKVRDVLSIADRVYALRRGSVVYDGPAQTLVEDSLRLREVFL